MPLERIADQVAIHSVLGKRRLSEAPNEIGRLNKKLHEHVPVPEIALSIGLLFKIFHYLEPLDLLHLARTSKSLRKVLMSRESSSVWKAARQNVPLMPDCLPGMTEPQFAYLAFGDDCHFCGKTDKVQTHWHLRIRVCKACFEDENKFEEKEASKCPANIKRIIPTASATYHPVFLEPLPQYIAAYMKEELMEEHYQLPRKKRDWGKAQARNREICHKLESACWFWSMNLQRYREEERCRRGDSQSNFDERKQQVVEHIRRLGWGNEHLKITEAFARPEDSPVVMEACRQPLTKQALMTLEPFLNKFMEDFRGARLRKEFGVYLAACLPQLNRIYNAYLSGLPSRTGTLEPSFAVILKDFAIRRAVERAPRIPDSISSYLDWEVLFQDAIARWQRLGENELAALIGDARGDQLAFEPVIALNMATTWFTCYKCRSSLRPHPALLHSCPAEEEQSGTDVYTAALTKVLPNVRSHSRSTIRFDLKDCDLMSKVVHLCGFEPKAATAQELNAANPILECVTCNHPRKGRATMKWTKVLKHIRRKHSDVEVPDLYLLPDEEKQLVLQGMDVKQAQRMCQLDYRGLACRHCRLVSNMVDLTQHVKLQHSQSEPTPEDTVPIQDESHLIDVYWLWPPRSDSS